MVLTIFQCLSYTQALYHSFEMTNLPSLQSIEIGERCFCYASSFSLTGLIDWFEFTDLPQLQSVKLGSLAFCFVHSVVFESD